MILNISRIITDPNHLWLLTANPNRIILSQTKYKYFSTYFPLLLCITGKLYHQSDNLLWHHNCYQILTFIGHKHNKCQDFHKLNTSSFCAPWCHKWAIKIVNKPWIKKSLWSLHSNWWDICLCFVVICTQISSYLDLLSSTILQRKLFCSGNMIHKTKRSHNKPRSLKRACLHNQEKKKKNINSIY